MFNIFDFRGKKTKAKVEKEVRKPNNNDGNEYTYDKETFESYEDLKGLWEISEMRLDPDQNNEPKYKNEFQDEKKWNKAKKYNQKPFIYESALCICGKEGTETDLWIQCDFCQKWYHPECVGVDPEKAHELESYKCKLCKTPVDIAQEKALNAMLNATPSDFQQLNSIVTSGKRKRQTASYRERLIHIGINAAKTELSGPLVTGARKIAEDAYIIYAGNEEKDSL